MSFTTNCGSLAQLNKLFSAVGIEIERVDDGFDGILYQAQSHGWIYRWQA